MVQHQKRKRKYKRRLHLQRGSGLFDAIGDAFRAIPSAFGSVQSGISGVINNPDAIGSRIDKLTELAEKAGEIGKKVGPLLGGYKRRSDLLMGGLSRRKRQRGSRRRLGLLF